VLEDTKASRCGLNGLDAAVESFGRSVADGAGKPDQDSIKAIVQHASHLLEWGESTADRPCVPRVEEGSDADCMDLLPKEAEHLLHTLTKNFRRTLKG
jgi:hypothetical protein